MLVFVSLSFDWLIEVLVSAVISFRAFVIIISMHFKLQLHGQAGL